MSRRKKSNAQESPTSTSLSEHYVRMDIDIQALRANNKALVQSVAKLQQEKAIMQKQHTVLQEEYFKLNSKYVNLKNIFSTIDSTIKLTFSNMADGVNHLAKIMHLCSVGNAVSGLNKEPKTLTVKPHMVNGTVIQNPTITLSRFNDSDSHEAPNNNEQQQRQVTSPRQQITQDLVPESEIQPSTSRGLNESISDFFNNIYNQTEEEEEEIVTDNVSRHSRRNTLVLDNPEEENDQEQNDILDEDEVTDHTYCQRLVTINEEPEDFDSLNSTGTVTDRVREIRIYLSPLPVEHTKDGNNSVTSFVGRSSSLSAEASNSILNSTLLNESNKSPDRKTFLNSMNISMPSPSSSRFEGFDNSTINGTMEASKETNRPSCSFINNLSSIIRCQSIQEDDMNNSSDTGNSKIIAMQTLGLMEKTSEVTSSTPVIQTQRSSRRLNKKSMDISVVKSKMSPIMSNITRRKVSSGTLLPQVIIKRLNLDQSSSPKDSLANILDTTPRTSITDIKNKSRKRKATETTSKLENDTQNNKESVKRTVMTKGKENRKKPLVVSTQSIKSSPRPKRAARPTVLRETSLKKKMRRSR